MIFDEPLANPHGMALDDLTRKRTWSEVIDRVWRIARLLRAEFGLQPEDHAAFLTGNRVECIELSLGAILAGIWMFLRDRNNLDEDDYEDYEDDEVEFENAEEVMDAIIALDDLHRAKKIPDEAYQLRREELKERLKELA